MADPVFEKLDDGKYQITNGEKVVPITPEDFEDLYFSVEGLAPSYFYRSLTDNCCKDDDQRLAIKEMVENSDLGLNKSLEKLMQDIMALPEPETS